MVATFFVLPYNPMRGRTYMSQITDDIKSGQFRDVYLLYGEEAYLREYNRKALVSALSSPSDTLNRASFAGDDLDVKQLLSLAQTLPFMAEKRVITVKNSGFFKNACDELFDYLNAPSHDTVLIFDESDVDKRSRNFKAAVRLGAAVEAAGYKEPELKRWIAGYLGKSGRQIRETTAELIISRVGTDMSQIAGELEKLISSSGDRPIISDEDVKAICIINPSGTVFQMIDAMASKKQHEAVSIYYEMLAQKQNPYGILALIERHFRILLTVGELSKKNASSQIIASKAGIPPYAVKRYQAQASKYTRAVMEAVLEDCASSDCASKNGMITDKMAVELIIIRYSV